MEEREILEIDDKEFFLLDSIKSEDTTYVFFTETTDLENTIVLKEIELNNELYYQEIINDHEYNKALTLFNEKHQ